jgi:hypothetical protein
MSKGMKNFGGRTCLNKSNLAIWALDVSLENELKRIPS